VEPYSAEATEFAALHPSAPVMRTARTPNIFIAIPWLLKGLRSAAMAIQAYGRVSLR